MERGNNEGFDITMQARDLVTVSNEVVYLFLQCNRSVLARALKTIQDCLEFYSEVFKFF